jgi:oligopeptide transport system permease protein
MSDPDAVADLERVQETGLAVPDGRSLAQDAWRRLRSNWVFWASLVVILFLVVISIVPGLFTSHDPGYCIAGDAREGPSGRAWFGYDVQGCDVYARTIYGARASIVVGTTASAIALFVGAGVGVYAGFYGGIIDSLLSRVTDIFFALPLLITSIVILSALPLSSDSEFQSILKVAVVLAALGWTSTARVARSSVLQVKQADYVSASRALGASRWWTIRQHILPNAAAPVIVVTTISLGGFIATEATLSYLGIGLQPPVVSWGIAISDAAVYVRTTPHMLFFPAAFLSVAVLAFIALGDAVREALDPRAAAVKDAAKLAAGSPGASGTGIGGGT